MLRAGPGPWGAGKDERRGPAPCLGTQALGPGLGPHMPCVSVLSLNKEVLNASQKKHPVFQLINVLSNSSAETINKLLKM